MEPNSDSNGDGQQQAQDLFNMLLQGGFDGGFQGHDNGVSSYFNAYQPQYQPGPPAWNPGYGLLPGHAPGQASDSVEQHWSNWAIPSMAHPSGSGHLGSSFAGPAQFLPNHPVVAVGTRLPPSMRQGYGYALPSGSGHLGSSFAGPGQPSPNHPVIAVGTRLPPSMHQGNGYAHVGQGPLQAAALGPWMNAPSLQAYHPPRFPSAPVSPRVPAPAKAAMDTPPLPDHVFLQFGNKLLQIKCPQCGSQVIRKEVSLYQQAAAIALVSDAKATMTDNGSPSTAVPPICCAPCPACNICVCIGCCRNEDVALVIATSPSVDRRCCDEGRLSVIWVLLCASASKKQCQQQLVTQNKTAEPNRRRGDRGIGYNGPSRGSGTKPWQQDSDRNPKQSERNERDNEFRCFLNALVRALPSLPDGSGPCSLFDQHPPPLVSAMVRRSFLLAEMAEMLRNDSIKDIVSRGAVYESLFRLVRQLQEHPHLRALIYGKRYDYPLFRSLLYATFPIPTETPMTNKEPEAVQPLAPLLRSLGKLARSMLQRVSKHRDAYTLNAANTTTRLCEQMCSLADLAAKHDGAGDGEGQTGGTDVPGPDNLETLAAWHKEHAVAEMDDEELLSSHALEKEARAMLKKTTRAGRMKKLIDEVTILSSSLPSGIYVRHGSSRLDVMKVLIEGPQGTPYEFGLFEFDVLCPYDYPAKPPLVHFRSKTTDELNPNLYNDGSVCLSLLGTWKGEPWNPQHSTLLQVLVSLQGMVLCEEPWCNEPGRYTENGKSMSVKYNFGVRKTVITHYTQPWVSSPSGIWAEVMQRHLRAKAGEILKSVERWCTLSVAVAKKNGSSEGPGVNMAQLRVVLSGHTDSGGGVPGDAVRPKLATNV